MSNAEGAWIIEGGPALMTNLASFLRTAIAQRPPGSQAAYMRLLEAVEQAQYRALEDPKPDGPAMAKLRATDMQSRSLTPAEMWWMLCELKRELA